MVSIGCPIFSAKLQDEGKQTQPAANRSVAFESGLRSRKSGSQKRPSWRQRSQGVSETSGGRIPFARPSSKAAFSKGTPSGRRAACVRSEEHTSELQSHS